MPFPSMQSKVGHGGHKHGRTEDPPKWVHASQQFIQRPHHQGRAAKDAHDCCRVPRWVKNPRGDDEQEKDRQWHVWPLRDGEPTGTPTYEEPAKYPRGGTRTLSHVRLLRCHHGPISPNRSPEWSAPEGASLENQLSLTSTPFQKATRSTISFAASLGVG
jgi:hypothetical protein